jgi:hypothetical protein
MTLDRVWLQKFAADIALGIMIYFLLEFAKTQEAQPQDWTSWATGALFGALYRVLPTVMATLVALRDGTLLPAKEVEVIGDGRGEL